MNKHGLSVKSNSQPVTLPIALWIKKPGFAVSNVRTHLDTYAEDYDPFWGPYPYYGYGTYPVGVRASGDVRVLATPEITTNMKLLRIAFIVCMSRLSHGRMVNDVCTGK